MYRVDGDIGTWLERIVHSRWPVVQYRWVTQEFGTYRMVRLLQALRLENFRWWHDPENCKDNSRAIELRGWYYPESEGWKNAVLARGAAVLAQSFFLAFGS